MLSLVIDGVVHDWKYTQLKDGVYKFSVGPYSYGLLYRMGRNTWSAVAFKENNICPVGGFNSRYYAACFLLRMNGFKVGG